MTRTILSICVALSLCACVIQPQPTRTTTTTPAPQRPAPVIVPAPAPAPAGALDLFNRIRIGMPRPEAEAILGAPNTGATLPGGAHEAWYLPPPPVKKPRAPKAPGAICVIYRGGRVEGKRLSPQFP